VSDDMINWKTKGTALYQQLPSDMKKSWKAVEPLTEIPKDWPAQESLYKTWEDIKKTN